LIWFDEGMEQKPGLSFRRALQVIAGLLVLVLPGCTTVQPVTPADTLIWCGLDYTKVKMIGSSDFRRPEEIFPGMLEKWNDLFLREMLPKLADMAPVVRPDTAAVYAHNENASPDQIVREDGSYDGTVRPSEISEADIQEMVRSYQLHSNTGLGLVFVMDRLVKRHETGCMYAVFFDVGSRNVVFSTRICSKAGGGGFRNYWFNPVKQTVAKLPGVYRKAAAAHHQLLQQERNKVGA
jgi:hypothetical protein